MLLVVAAGLMARHVVAGAGMMATTPGPSPYGVFRQIMSPFCPGLTLAACPSPAAEHLRTEIKTRMAAGESSDAIERDLITRYGERVRAMPPAGDALPLGIGRGLGRSGRMGPVSVREGACT